MNKRLFLVILLIFIAGIFLMGCYTMLAHPGVEGEEEAAYSGTYYREHCTDCHTDYHNYPYGYYYGFSPDYYWNYPRWGHYYNYPWWWDWYGGDYSGVEEVPNNIEKGERRRGLAPPYSGESTTPVPIITVPGSKGERGVIEKTVKEEPKEQGKEEKSKEETTKKEGTEDKAPRRR